MKTAILCAGAAILHAVAPASAAVINQSQNTGLVAPEINTRLSNFNRFDPALGTLTSVTVKPSEVLVNAGAWSSFANTPQTFYIDMSSELQVSGPTHFIDYPNSMTTGPISAPALASGVSFSNGSNNSPGPQVYTDALTLTIFTGPGNVGFDIQTIFTKNAVTGGSSITLFQSLQISSAIDLTYTYTPAVAVPEPCTIALLGIGMCGLLVRRRGAKRGS